MHEDAEEAGLRLSVVVPTCGDWAGLSEVVDSLLPAVHSLGVEVIAVSGSGGKPAVARPGVTYLEAAEPDVFRGRAAAAARATGDVVALVEDHQRVDSAWASGLLDAWRTHRQADVLVHSMRTRAGAGTWELALFTLVSGPFLAVDRMPLDRLPMPGIVSFRRSLLVDRQPEPGYIEYELLGLLQAQDRIVMVDIPLPVHVQPAGWRAPTLAFHSARMFAGVRAADGASRRVELRRMSRDLPHVFRQTIAARRRTNDGNVGVKFAVAVTVLVASMVVGQTVGIVTRSTGDSARHLD